METEFKPMPKRLSIAERLKREKALSLSLGGCTDKWVFVADHQVIAAEDTVDQVFDKYDETAEEILDAGATSLRIFKVLGPEVNLVPSTWK